jgi:hypothetical protein
MTPGCGSRGIFRTFVERSASVTVLLRRSRFTRSNAMQRFRWMSERREVVCGEIIGQLATEYISIKERDCVLYY